MGDLLCDIKRLEEVHQPMTAISIPCWILWTYAIGAVSSIAVFSAVDDSNFNLGYVLSIGLLWPLLMFWIVLLLIAAFLFISLHSYDLTNEHN